MFPGAANTYLLASLQDHVDRRVIEHLLDESVKTLDIVWQIQWLWHLGCKCTVTRDKHVQSKSVNLGEMSKY